MGWHTLIGAPMIYAGAAGTVQLGKNEALLFVSAWASAASATLTVFGGPAISIPQTSGTSPAGIWSWWIEHTLFTSNLSLSGTPSDAGKLVFTNTAHYFVHSVAQGTRGSNG